jgi:DNA-binding MarR family transcriptional regulator
MTHPDFGELSTPTLMRSARGTYARSIRGLLHEIGIDDLPRNGAFILAGIDATGGPRQDLHGDLGVTKQAVSQLLDILVRRGYVERSTDADDRRRISLDLTDRGRQAVEAVYAGVEAVDAQLREKISDEQIEAMRSALTALTEIKIADIAAGTGRPRPARQFRSFSPIFGVSDLRAALAHYASLGFKTIAYEEGDEYGFANRDGTSLHLAAHHDHGDDGPAGHVHDGASAYLNVADADLLFQEWTRPGIGGTTSPVHSTDYQMREGSHTDPDGNLIRFGSQIPD